MQERDRDPRGRATDDEKPERDEQEGREGRETHTGLDALGIDDVIEGDEPVDDDEVHFHETRASNERLRPL
jgi:hypothetical protein